MSSSSVSAKIAKSVLFLIVLALFIFLLYWLWQRQPKKAQPKTETKIETVQSATEQKNQSQINPPNFSTLTQKDVKIEGVTNASSYVALYTNSSQNIVESGENGNFSTNFQLEGGLNQVQIITFSKADLTEESRRNLTYFLAGDKDKLAQNSFVYAGSIKTIFDTLLSISTEDGDKKIQTKKSTDIVFPKGSEEQSATASALSAARIGDFAIGIGTVDKEKVMSAQKLQIIRDNKPQITDVIKAVKILKEPKLNLFSANDLKDNKILEFTLNKETQISQGNSKSDTKNIKKDKRAIIIFEKDGEENIADLVYLLP